MEKANKTQRLTETAVCIAIAAALELISGLIPFLNLPFGGGFTLASMLPLVIIAYRYGTRWGLFSGFVYGLVEALTSIKTVSAYFLPQSEEYQGLWRALLICALDYLVAFTVLGLAGTARKIKNPSAALCTGTVIALFARYIVHIVSGAVFFGSWAEWFFTQENFYSFGAKIVDSFSGASLAIIYSVVYNGLYMIPEIILTAIAALVVGRVSSLAKRFEPPQKAR